MKVLITGGAGFIGSHTADCLLENGHSVRVLDNLAPPTHDGVVPDWLDKRADFLLGDVRDKKDWEKALKDIDAVVHLAAYMDYHLDFSNYIRTNVESIALMFEVIEEQKLPIKKIIVASSQSVYGEGKYLCSTHGEIYAAPRKEEQLQKHDWEQHCTECGARMKPVAEKEDDQLKPQIPYGVSKVSSEHILFNLGKICKIPVVALRYSIVLGPRQSFRHFYSGALRSFAVNVLSNKPIQMQEDAGQLRDFVDVRDVAKSHLVVLQDGRADNQVFNVGAGESVKVIDLARLVAEEGGVEFNPSLNNQYRVGGARHSLMNVEKLKELDWKLEYSLRQTVHDYLQWVRQFGDLSKILNKTYEDMKKEGILREC